MPCYHPMFALRPKNYKKLNVLTKDGKPNGQYKIISSNYEAWQDYKKLYANEYDFAEIPCGKCIGCRLEYSRQWAIRCMIEAKEYEENHFITLTYDNQHVPKNNGVIDYKTGEVGEVLTLKPKDMQDFLKRLRIQWERKHDWKKIKGSEIATEKGIRFYGCGEYGDKKNRPHYHLIMYNLPIYDLTYWYTASNGTKIYRSEEIEKIWGKGIVAVCDVSWETCAYVARYVMKKVKGKEAVQKYLDSGKIQEFTRMSRAEGIAKNYYKKNKEKIYQYDYLLTKNKKGIFKVKPARYFDKLFDIDEPETMEEIKNKRKEIAEMIEESENKRTGINKLKRLELQEEYKNKVIKQLKRTI